MTILVCGAQPKQIVDALDGALLTDEEFRCPQDWMSYDDPFGDWHEEPCQAPADNTQDTVAHEAQDGDRA
jgi:hypothetical protein